MTCSSRRCSTSWRRSASSRPDTHTLLDSLTHVFVQFVDGSNTFTQNLKDSIHQASEAGHFAPRDEDILVAACSRTTTAACATFVANVTLDDATDQVRDLSTLPLALGIGPEAASYASPLAPAQTAPAGSRIGVLERGGVGLLCIDRRCCCCCFLLVAIEKKPDTVDVCPS